MIQSHFNNTTPPFKEGISEQHQACLKSVQTLLKTEASSTHHHLDHHHLHLQYVNTELSPSVSPVCKYWKHHHLYLQYRNTESIITSIFSIEIRSHHHLHLQYVNTETSSISLVWEYWNIIICIFILYLEILDFYVLRWNTGLSVITTIVIT